MKRRVKLGDIEFSVVEEEKPRDMVTITDHQVEKGQDVSDHVKQESSIIDIVGVIVGDDATATLSKLQRHQKEGTLSTYIGRNVYNNMAILTMDRNHGKDIANGFAYNIALKQVRISTAKEVELTVVNPITKKASPKTATQVKKKTNNGKQQPRQKAIQGPTQTASSQIQRLGMYQSGLAGQEKATPLTNMTKIANLYKAPQDRILGIYKGGLS